MLNLGDDIEDETPEIDRVRDRECLDTLRASGAELVNVAGNHDYYNLTPAEILDAWGRTGELFYSVDRGGVHFTVLCTRQRSNVNILVDEPQLAWLDADLAATNLPTVVLMHHPAADQDLRGNRWFEGLTHLALIENRARVREILARHGRTQLVLNGHLHWNHVALMDGIPYVTLQSLIENLDEDAPGRVAAAHAEIYLDPPYTKIEIHGAERHRYEFITPRR